MRDARSIASTALAALKNATRIEAAERIGISGGRIVALEDASRIADLVADRHAVLRELV